MERRRIRKHRAIPIAFVAALAGLAAGGAFVALGATPWTSPTSAPPAGNPDLVVLEPSSPQIDGSSRPSVSIRDSGGGDLIRLEVQGASAPRFVVGNDGNVGIGKLPGTTANPPGDPIELDVAGDANASRLCINGDCRADWSAVVPNAVTGSGSPTQVAYWTGANSIGGSPNFYWDAANGRLGVGTSTPAQLLHVNGTAQVATLYAATGVSTFNASVPSGTVEAGQLCLGDGVNCITAWADVFTNEGGVRGSGTTNTIPKWTAAGTIGDTTTPLAETASGIQWGGNRGLLRTDQGASIELGGTGTPYIDFSNDGAADYDARVVLTGNDSVELRGASLGIGAAPGAYALNVSGDANATRLCIAGVCMNSWTSAGIGANQNLFETVATPSGSAVADSPTDTLTLAQAGGITISANASTDTITFNTDSNTLQRRVTGSCATNQAIRVINADGTVTCVAAGGSGSDGDWTISGTNMYSGVSGNVGIGYSNPAYKLDVNGNIRANRLYVYSAAFGISGIYSTYSGTYILGDHNNANVTLSAAGGILFLGYQRTGSIRFYSGNTTGIGTERMRLTNTGRLGIGITNPADMLHVSGNMRAQRVRVQATSHQLQLYDTDTGQFEWTVTTYNNQDLGFYHNDSSNGSIPWDANKLGFVIQSSGGGVVAHGYYHLSDRSLKTDIRPLDGEDALNRVLQLRGVSFRWKDQPDRVSLGFIAQEVDEVFPEVVTRGDEAGTWSLDYGKLAAPIVETIKRQQVQMDELEETLSRLEEELRLLGEQ